MKVLLVNPPIYDFSAYDVWLKPLGLLYLSSILKEFGIEVVMLDCLDRNLFLDIPAKEDGTGKYPQKDIKKPDIISNIPLNYKRYGAKKEKIEEILSLNKDTDYVVVTSSMTYWYLGVVEIVETIKNYLPKAKIILGGIYPILLPNHAKKLFSDKVDIIITSSNFSEILEYLQIPEAKKYLHFSNFPIPDYTLYSRIWYVVMRFSYGCLNSCSYCASRAIFPSYQTKTETQIIDEILKLYHLTMCKNFVLYDDALLNTKNLDFIFKVFKNLTNLNLDIRFFTPNGINPKFVTKEIASLMRQLNFIDPRLSLETTSEITHNIVDRKVSFNDFENALKNLVSAGYKPQEISVYLLAGLPNETLEDVYNSINIISKYKVRIRLCEMSVVPKTKLFYDLGLDENTDPLLYNNTIFLFNGIPNKVKAWCSFNELQILKNYVKNLNFKNLNELKYSYV